MMTDNQRQKDNGFSFWHRAAFGVGGMGDNLMQNAVNNIANQVLNIFLGVNPALISLAIFISRIWDAFTDPVMGSISDNTRTRFGRRKPFILIGGITAAVVFVLIWRFPFVRTETGYFFWFLFCTLLFYTCYTVFSVPYNALSYELSPNYNERTRIMAAKCIFGAVAGLAIQWQFKLTQLDCFENTLDGMQTVSLGVAGIILFTTAVPALFSRERLTEEISLQKKIRLFDSLKTTLRNKTFTRLMLAVVLICLGLFMVSQLGVYINIYYIFDGDKRAASTMLGFAGSAYHILGGIAAAPVISFISSKIGKKKTLMAGLLLALIGAGSKYITYHPDWPWMQLVSLSMMSPGLACLWILSPSMVADICDQDELENNVRREGMFSAVYGYVMKIGVSLGFLMTGLILNASGFDATLGTNQPPQAIQILRILFAVVPVVGLTSGLLLVSRFPITPAKAAETRRQLELRGKSAGTEGDSIYERTTD